MYKIGSKLKFIKNLNFYYHEQYKLTVYDKYTIPIRIHVVKTNIYCLRLT